MVSNALSNCFLWIPLLVLFVKDNYSKNVSRLRINNSIFLLLEHQFTLFLLCSITHYSVPSMSAKFCTNGEPFRRNAIKYFTSS
jgi:hypothetical protein